MGTGRNSEIVSPAPEARDRCTQPRCWGEAGPDTHFLLPSLKPTVFQWGGGDLPTHFCLASCSCEALQEEAEARGGRRKGSILLAVCFSSSGSSAQPQGFTLGGSPLLSSAGVPYAVVRMPTELASQLGLPPQGSEVPFCGVLLQASTF